MVNYGNGKIYKIERLSDNCVVYVGSTTKKYLSSRLVEHKNKATKYPNRRVYKSISNNEGWENHQMLLIKPFACNSRDELHSEESRFIRVLKPLTNIIIPLRTRKEYRIDNKETIKETAKSYRNNNVEKVRETKKQEYLRNRDKHLERCKKNNLKNKDAYAVTRKLYRQNNADRIRERCSSVSLCICGQSYTHQHKDRHLKSKQHINSIPVQFKLIEEMHNNRKIYIPQPLPTLI